MRGIDDLLREATARGRIAGAAAAAATRDGIVYRGAFGRLRAGESTPLPIDAIFRIASMTKAITSVAALQLVERGQLDLDADAGEVLPALREPRVLEGFDPDSSEPVLRPAASAVTTRQLLTHTSGLAYEIWSPALARYMREQEVPSILARGEGFLEVPLVHDPGARWTYGIGIDRVGQIVERVSGLRLDAYLREHVLGPLGMDDTGFAVSGARLPRVTDVFARDPDGTLQPGSFGVPSRVEFCSGGGGLHSTALDYLRFLRMVLGRGALDGARVLAAESVAEMARNQIGTLEPEILRTALPAMSNDVEFFPGTTKRWGLGFLINTEPVEGGRTAGSLAWAGIFNGYYWIDPASGVCGVLLTQTLPFFDPEVVALFESFERAVYASV